MRECFIFALIAINKRLLQHLNDEKLISDRDVVGMFSQLAEKIRLFEGKNPDGSDQVTALVAETLKLLNRNAETDG